MNKPDYFQLITKYISPSSKTFGLYLIHTTLVTNKALDIGRQLKLGTEQLSFIERSAMLHDIGIIKVSDPEIGCVGTLPYIQHGIEGQKILESEGLIKEARVCLCHLGVGLYKEDIINNHLPLPPMDMFPETIEEKIITFADLFFSKNPQKLWQERSIAEARAKLKNYSENHLDIFDHWAKEFVISL